jgi:TIR domain
VATLVISYARADQPLVRAVVRLLRTALREIDDAVYWDEDFEPGELWFEQIARSIDGAPRLFVFWCAHSAASAQVLREMAYALAAGKVVVPVLLDDTCLCDELAPIHGVDLRSAVLHAGPVSPKHGHVLHAYVTSSAVRWALPAAAVVALALGAAYQLAQPVSPVASASFPSTSPTNSAQVAQAKPPPGPEPTPGDADVPVVPNASANTDAHAVAPRAPGDSTPIHGNAPEDLVPYFEDRPQPRRSLTGLAAGFVLGSLGCLALFWRMMRNDELPIEERNLDLDDLAGQAIVQGFRPYLRAEDPG